MGVLDEDTDKAIAAAVSQGIEGDVSRGGSDASVAMYERLRYPMGFHVARAASGYLLNPDHTAQP